MIFLPNISSIPFHCLSFPILQGSVLPDGTLEQADFLTTADVGFSGLYPDAADTRYFYQSCYKAQNGFSMTGQGREKRRISFQTDKSFIEFRRTANNFFRFEDFKKRS